MTGARRAATAAPQPAADTIGHRPGAGHPRAGPGRRGVCEPLPSAAAPPARGLAGSLTRGPAHREAPPTVRPRPPDRGVRLRPVHLRVTDTGSIAAPRPRFQCRPTRHGHREGRERGPPCTGGQADGSSARPGNRPQGRAAGGPWESARVCFRARRVPRHVWPVRTLSMADTGSSRQTLLACGRRGGRQPGRQSAEEAGPCRRDGPQLPGGQVQVTCKQ